MVHEEGYNLNIKNSLFGILLFSIVIFAGLGWMSSSTQYHDIIVGSEINESLGKFTELEDISSEQQDLLAQTDPDLLDLFVGFTNAAFSSIKLFLSVPVLVLDIMAESLSKIGFPAWVANKLFIFVFLSLIVTMLTVILKFKLSDKT